MYYYQWDLLTTDRQTNTQTIRQRFSSTMRPSDERSAYVHHCFVLSIRHGCDKIIIIIIIIHTFVYRHKVVTLEAAVSRYQNDPVRC